MTKYNPFKPGSIVHPGMFTGRTEEMRTVEDLFFQTKNQNPGHFIIHGERGIGKSSLLFYLDLVARGEIDSLDGVKFKFLAISLIMEPSDTYKDLIRKIAREFEIELNKNEIWKKILKDIWSFITNWEILGVKYSKEKDSLSPEEMLEELIQKIAVVSEKLTNEIDGIYLFIDEADKPDVTLNLGGFVKYITEKLTKLRVNNFGLGVIGISNVIDKIRETHESAIRVFTIIGLNTLSLTEREQVILRGLEEAKNKNKFETSIGAPAMSMLSNLSEGFPHFIQQYAYSTFDLDTDNEITVNDVVTGLTHKEKGALHQLGMRYFQSMYFKEIYSEDYRKVLQIMAKESQDKYVSKRVLAEKSGLKAYTINNAISALLKKNIIIPKTGTKGEYRLSSTSFGAWILTMTNVMTNNESSEF
ncbi:ATP-binding protein [Leptospira yasudae]|uniref:ATP-binding protein n=1 Tax=Leptospira yasudae TaxID=2202201 RepID=UPI001C4EEF2A|nr:ATP-binding protein [Leptospira yasudae]MBW0434907.1 ATP-binding protein [Leptospira yasudae]